MIELINFLLPPRKQKITHVATSCHSRSIESRKRHDHVQNNRLFYHSPRLRLKSRYVGMHENTCNYEGEKVARYNWLRSFSCAARWPERYFARHNKR